MQNGKKTTKGFELGKKIRKAAELKFLLNLSDSKIAKPIVGRDRRTWRHAIGRRLLLCHGGGRNPLLTVEPDSKHTGMYRNRFPDVGLSDMVNLTRAKDAALAFALRAFNYEAQETPPEPHWRRPGTNGRR
jgi:hypothetical protein